MKFIVLSFAVILFFPAQARDKLLDIQEVTSPGGVKAWLVEDHNVPVIAMEFAFTGAGAILNPPDMQGLSQLLSNTMDEGAGELTSQAFQKELRDQSISLSFNSSRDHFGGSLNTLARNKKRAFELTALALTKPRFDEEPVGRMRAANQSRIRSSLTDPEWINARILNDVAFQGHVYAQNSGGTLSSLEKIGPAALRDFHRKYIGKNNLVVAVAGDVTKDELAATLDQVFGALPNVTLPAPPPVIDVQNQGKITIFKKEIPQTVIEILQPGIDRGDPDYQIAQVMDFVLGSSGFGSRLTEEIREKRGLTYGIYSYYLNMKYLDGLEVSTSTENKNVSQVIELTKAEWERMKNQPISAQELKDTQAYLVGSLPLSLTSTGDIASMLLSLQVDDMPIDYLDRREAAIRKATVADVQRIAQKLLDASKMTIIMTGNPEGITGTAVEKIPNVE